MVSFAGKNRAPGVQNKRKRLNIFVLKTASTEEKILKIFGFFLLHMMTTYILPTFSF
jgi:hypothetical protein